MGQSRGALLYLPEDVVAGPERICADVMEKLGTQLSGNAIDLLQHRLRAFGEAHRFAAPIMCRFVPLDPPVSAQAIQEPDECRALNTKSRGKVFLGQRASTREMNQGQTFGLTQAKRSQAVVELMAPRARGFVQQPRKFFGN